MKKTVIIVATIVLILGVFCYTNCVQAVSEAIDPQTESKLIQIKEESQKTLEDYKLKYGSDTYGFVAFILNLVRIYSIPLCFIGIAIAGIHQYVIGIRKLDTQERGLTWMVTFITILIICQVLPLAFAIVVKFGRG